MEDMEVREVFSGLKAHMIEGMVFHDQLAQYFEFLGLKGYAKMHEYHYADETHGYRKLIHMFYDEYDMLIPQAPMDRVAVIPDNWYMYHGSDVDASTKMNAVKNGMEMWIEWEDKTKAMYKETYKKLSEGGESDAAQMIACRFMDADEELSCAREKQKMLEDIGYDLTTIMGRQDEIYEKYKEKITGIL